MSSVISSKNNLIAPPPPSPISKEDYIKWKMDIKEPNYVFASAPFSDHSIPRILKNQRTITRLSEDVQHLFQELPDPEYTGTTCLDNQNIYDDLKSGSKKLNIREAERVAPKQLSQTDSFIQSQNAQAAEHRQKKSGTKSPEQNHSEQEENEKDQASSANEHENTNGGRQH